MGYQSCRESLGKAQHSQRSEIEKSGPDLRSWRSPKRTKGRMFIRNIGLYPGPTGTLAATGRSLTVLFNKVSVISLTGQCGRYLEIGAQILARDGRNLLRPIRDMSASGWLSRNSALLYQMARYCRRGRTLSRHPCGRAFQASGQRTAFPLRPGERPDRGGT